MTRDFPYWRFTCSNLDKALSRTSFLQWHRAKPGQGNDQWKVAEKLGYWKDFFNNYESSYYKVSVFENRCLRNSSNNKTLLKI